MVSAGVQHEGARGAGGEGEQWRITWQHWTAVSCRAGGETPRRLQAE